jgi:hypothetical protein
MLGKPSRQQLELQARMAQKRVDDIKRILASGVQAPAKHDMDEDTKRVIARLYDTSLSDADISSCISILEMLLLLEGLPPLLNLMKSKTYSMPLRQQAATAIAKIGSNHIVSELETLRSSDVSELSRLAKVALGIEN